MGCRESWGDSDVASVPAPCVWPQMWGCRGGGCVWVLERGCEKNIRRVLYLVSSRDDSTAINPTGWPRPQCAWWVARAPADNERRCCRCYAGNLTEYVHCEQLPARSLRQDIVQNSRMKFLGATRRPQPPCATDARVANMNAITLCSRPNDTVRWLTRQTPHQPPTPPPPRAQIGHLLVPPPPLPPLGVPLGSRGRPRGGLEHRPDGPPPVLCCRRGVGHLLA